MTQNQKLGVREEVDLREVWPNEAYDFTPWKETCHDANKQKRTHHN